MRSVLIFLTLLVVLWCGAATTWGADQQTQVVPWWHRYPIYVGDVGGGLTAPEIAALDARMVSGNCAADPTWGPFGQRQSTREAAARLAEARRAGVRWITWVEAFGQCCLYAAALEQNADGSFVRDNRFPELARLTRTAWSWTSPRAKTGNAFRFVGLHNAVNDEDFVRPEFTRERLGLPVPRYPDGREAVGWLAQGRYPVNARVYDACCAKDINGQLSLELEMLIPDPQEGLYRAVLDKNQAIGLPGAKAGDTVYAPLIYLGKDPASPFWIDYIRVSVREILKQGIDGLWCDNYSPWDNFGQFSRAFGDWSEHRFRQFLGQRFSPDKIERSGIGDPGRFDVRAYLKQRAVQFGAKDPSYLRDRAWGDPRWLDDPVWNAYKVFKQEIGREGLRNFYSAVKDEARKAGRTDFLVSGNDMPVFGLGWARDDYLDMVSSEQSPGWYLTTGSRGIMIPPLGKYAVVYRAALEHQKGPYATVWYYLKGPYEKYRGKPELAKVLMAEAFANGTFIKYGGNPAHPGTPESVAWWNAFCARNEERFGRRVAVAEVGVLYSPDNQLALLAPGGPPEFDRQPHSFSHWGLATALIDAHIPYRAVVDWKLAPAPSPPTPLPPGERGELGQSPGERGELGQPLRGLRVLVIPDAECLDDAVLPVLDQWVRNGGRLVITGPSGTRYGTQGFFRRRERSLFEPLVGREMRGGGLAAAGTGDLTIVGIDPTRPLAQQRRKPTTATTARDRATVYTRTLGRGAVVWTPEAIGIDYYLQAEERAVRLKTILEMIGPSTRLDQGTLPSTVGAFCWQAPDGKTQFVDLVNYALDAEADRVTRAEDLQFRVRLPDGWTAVDVQTLSPDDTPPAKVSLDRGWAVVRLPGLEHFVSVKLTGLKPCQSGASAPLRESHRRPG